MTRIKLSNDTIRYINLFEKMTRARVKDCILEEGKVTFVVKEGDAGMAIGKNGSNVKSIRKRVNMDVEIIEHYEDPKKFVNNLFKPIEVREVEIIENEKGSVFQAIVQKDRILARSKMKKAKELMEKYYNFAEISFS